MGNTIGGRRKVKVMKMDGETIKLKIPVRAQDVIKDYPGLVLLESESVKQQGIRAKPLEPQQELKARKVYFLVDLPKVPEEKAIYRRVQSGLKVSAKDRLELLMLSRRSVSDISFVRPPPSDGDEQSSTGSVRLKMRLPKAQVAKLVEESKDGAEVAEKIMNLYKESTSNNDPLSEELHSQGLRNQPGSIIGESFKEHHEKRVRFLPTESGAARLNTLLTTTTGIH